VNPDAAAAIERLAAAGTLTREQARGFARVARRELVSVHGELRLLLYAGVLTTMAGVGLLVKENLDRIGPFAIASVLAIVAAVCLLWTARHAAPFTWGEGRASHPALDYILLLGVLLLGADLAYVEAQFTPLGAAWPWHLLLMALVMGALALRYDSRVVFSLALSSFAAWRGVSTSLLGQALWSPRPEALRVNELACGVLFALCGMALARSGRKPHFEPVAVHGGWLLLLAALLSGLDTHTSSGLSYALLTLFVSTGLAVGGVMLRRFSLFVMGVLAAYCGLTALAFRALGTGSDLPLYWFFFTSIAMLFALLAARRHIKEGA
jgi:hypothetical protein